MGSFDYTCCVSGLPITCGDEVRYFLLTKNPYTKGAENTHYLHDHWFPRTFPLKGKYDDYGSVENIANGPEKDVWLDGIKLDIIEQGWGENTCHDVPTNKEMSFDELLNAVQENRVLVQRDYSTPRLSKFKIKEDENLSPEERRDRQVPIGVPSMFRITNIVEKLGINVFDGNWGKKSVIIDSPEPNVVRVRCKNMYGKKHTDPSAQFVPGEAIIEQVEVLEQLRLELNEYATVISASADACGVNVNGRSVAQPDAQMLIFPKPGTYDGALSKYDNDGKEPLAVGHAMIREDVWQSMLTHNVEIYDDKYKSINVGIEYFRDDIKRAVKTIQDEVAANPNDSYITISYMLMDKLSFLGHIISKEIIPFTVGLASHFKLMMDRDALSEEFINTVAEFAFMHNVLWPCRYQWRLSSSAGPQFGEYGKHRDLLSGFADIADKIDKENKADE